MKKVILRAFLAIGAVLLAFSCNKANPDQNASIGGKPLTISATLSNALTKVAFTPGLNGSSKPMMSLTWESGDKLRVADHSDNSSYSDFTLESGATTNTATFTGTPVDATSYDVWVLHKGELYEAPNVQTQASDGNTAHIEYFAQKNGSDRYLFIC